MYWDRAIELQDVRGRWLQVHAMWSGPLGSPFPSDFPNVDPEIRRISSTLAVVAGRAELWETQAHVVVSCSMTGADPGDLWSALAGVPVEQADDQGEAAVIEILPSAAAGRSSVRARVLCMERQRARVELCDGSAKSNGLRGWSDGRRHLGGVSGRMRVKSTLHPCVFEKGQRRWRGYLGHSCRRLTVPPIRSGKS